MTPVKGPHGQLSHVTDDLRRTQCGKRCDGWVVLDFRPSEQPHLVGCKTCRDIVEFN